MPKAAKSNSALIRHWISKFPGGIYSTDGKIIFCQRCLQKVSCSVFTHLKQHDDTAKHKECVARHSQEKNRQQFLAESCSSSNTDNTFYKDLCLALLGANIPFFKINNRKFKDFLEKYTGRLVPDQSTLRKNYLGSCFNHTLDLIKKSIGRSFVWATVDETTDCCGRYVANLLVGKLSPDGFSTPFLVSVKVLEATNHSTIARFVTNGLRNIGVTEDKLLLLSTDAARYMQKAARDVLSALYPKMIHVTCVCHGIHRVAEEIRSNFSDVDSLISNTKKVFLKAPSRVAEFKRLCPNTPLPPEPVLTRWTTWIKAAEYYSVHFKAVGEVIDRFDPNDAVSIRRSQELFSSSEIQHQLAYIHSNFVVIPSCITRLEAQGLSLAQSLDILTELKVSLSSAAGKVGQEVRTKLDKVLENNPGLHKLIDIAKILTGGHADIDMEPEALASMKYAPVVSCDVERSFSIYKTILSEKRTRFTPEHLEMYLICNCASEIDKE